MLFDSLDDAEPGVVRATQFTAVAPYYDELMSAVPYRFWLEYIERVWTRHELAPRRVLDLACGTGTMTRLLHAGGYDVAGVDISAGMLQIAERRTHAAGLSIPFYEQDAAELGLADARYDAVVCLFDSLNYILEPDRLRSAFQRIRGHLCDGGSFLFDVNTQFALEQGMFDQSSTRKDEPLHYRWRSSYDPETRLCTVRMRFEYAPDEAPASVFHEVHVQRAYGKDELRQWLADAGFAKVTIYDAYSLRAARKRSDRLFFLAQI
jgi:ubiquinone/menaquinone biosynthesis C-methylase UbiE